MKDRYKSELFRVLCPLMLVVIASYLNSCSSVPSQSSQNEPKTFAMKLIELEASSGGKIGFSAINTGNHSQIDYRANERFPVCSSFKAIAVAAILKKSMTQPGLLQKQVLIRKSDIESSGFAPVCEKYVSKKMTVAELCAAAIKQSDNTAANLLIKELGGPEAVTAFARSIGDTTFRLDRWEPDLNTAIPGDLRDTSTPAAMAKSLEILAVGSGLDLPQRQKYQKWLKENTTGDSRIRAGVPKDWIVGDKTGTCSYGTTIDIGVLWPPKSAPIVVALYFTQYRQSDSPKDEVLASLTRLLLNEFNVH